MAKQTQKQKNPNSKKKKVIIGTVCGLFGAAAIAAGLAIGLTQCHPIEMVTVKFFSDDPNVTISKESVSIKKGATFGEARSLVLASKTEGESQFILDHWYRQDDVKKEKIPDETVITETITACPEFNEIRQDQIIVNFTPESGDVGVVISEQSKVITRGETFAKISSDVTATKKTDKGNWRLKWWYKDGDKPTNEMSKDIQIGLNLEEKSLTVHPYFIPPLEKYTVRFATGGDPDVKFNTDELTYQVESGTLLSELLKECGIEATKVVDGVSWKLDCWTTNLKIPEDKPWEKPKDYGEDSQITENITLYPYFVEPENVWKPKTITWEKNGDKDFDKTFVLAPNQTDITISNFILEYTDGTTGVIPHLQDDEEVFITVDNKSGEGSPFKDTKIAAELIAPAIESSSEKLNVKFTLTDLPQTYVATDLLKFDVKFDVRFLKETKKEITIEGLELKLTQPWTAPTITYTKTTDTLETSEGSKNYFIDHTDSDRHFTISRKLKEDESLELKVHGDNANNLTATYSLGENENDLPTLDVSISFNKIDGIFTPHIANFTLEFIARNDTLPEKDAESIPINCNFTLVYTPVQDHEYGIVMDDTFVLAGDRTAQFAVQIENNITKNFASGDYVTITNLTRKELEAEGRQDECPIYFSKPVEASSVETKGQEGQKALQGEDSTNANLSFEIFFSNNTMPTDVVGYEFEIQIVFWKGDPGSDPDHPAADPYPTGTINKQIKVIYSPNKYEKYETRDWAQYRSFAIVQNAVNRDTGKLEQKIGTAWVLSADQMEGHGGNEQTVNLATAYDVRKDFDLMESDNYYNHQFCVTNYGAAKPYIAGDSTKYLLVNEDINNTEFDIMNTDLLNYQIDNEHIEWYDQSNFVWDGGQSNWAPNMAMFKIDLAATTQEGRGFTLYNQLIGYRKPVLIDWATKEGFYPEKPTPEYTGPYGQISGIFTNVPDDFSRDGFAYGYTGGFKSIDVDLKGDGKKARLLYWADYTMLAEIGELTYLDPLLYWNCEGYYDKLWKVGEEERQIRHRSGAFVMTLDSFWKSDYFNDAGIGSMFLLRRYNNDGTLQAPVIAGVNWNGGSFWNTSYTITPYFDCFQDGEENLLAPFLNPLS